MHITQIIHIQEDGRKYSDFKSIEADSNPCHGCGLCCQHFRISFYHGETTALPGGWVPVELTRKLNDFRVCMNNTQEGGKPCIALTSGFGTAKNSLGCSIYDNRPSVCREYHVWDDQGQPNPDCQKLRRQAGLPALLPISIPK